MKKLQEIQRMALDRHGRHGWRLHSIKEEQESSAKRGMIEGTEALEAAFDALDEGNREGSLAALRRVVVLAEKAIADIE